MARLCVVLDRLNRWLYRRRRRMRQALRPGLNASSLALFRESLGGPLPDELAELLAWHDGQSDDFQGTFADGWNLLSATEIVTVKEDLDQNPPPGWQVGWIPFARDDSDSFLVVDPMTSGVPVRAVWSGQETFPPIAASLTAWFVTLLNDFEAGRYVEDEERGTFFKSAVGPI